MSEMLAEAREILEDFSQEQLFNAVCYLRFVRSQPLPLDDFDYQMAREADLDTCTETVTLEELAERLGFNIEDL
ncbi:MAG: hypothetical protein FWB74_00880 [Defluviitaleaceae bacterium]|nr:hypothetical protein [Defluviitaleaceae bacterium]